MDKVVHKSNGSSISTTGTTSGSPHYSDTMENNLEYMNLDFVDNSESSSSLNNCPVDSHKVQNAKVTKPGPSKILPPSFLLHGSAENGKKNKPEPKEKSLTEMGYIISEVESWKNIQPPKSSLYTLLKNMINQHVKPNVQIRIGGVTFNCHMMVLQCYSEFFMELNNEILVQLPEEKVTPGAFMMVYDWMLADEPLVQREGILELFNAANFLRIQELINQCWFCLGDDDCFREDSAFLLYLEARSYGLEILEQVMLMRVCKFFMTLVASKDFLDLIAKEICTVLSSNTIAVNTEIEIFMSAIRWLSHDWINREQFMLDVIKCVRFALMPSWFLVTLINNVNCKEINRVVSHPAVKKMINDGISFVASQMHYGDNREEFLQFLDHLQLIAPKQRQWIYDKECTYHHCLGCSNMEYVTYKSFLDYLELIRTKGKDHWRSVEMVNEVEKPQQCCLRSGSRKFVDQKLAVASPSKVRDLNGQREGDRESIKGKEIQSSHQTNSQPKRRSKSALHRTPRGHPKHAPCTKKETTTESETEIKTAVNFKYTQENARKDALLPLHEQQQEQHAENILCDSKNYDTTDTNLKTGNTANFRPIVGHDTPVVPREAKHRRQEQHQQLHQAIKQHPTDVKCTVIYKRDENEASTCADADVMADMSGDTPNGQFANILNNNDDDDGGVVVGELAEGQQLVERRNGYSPSAYDIKWIPNRKIFVFGGIDPYCSHWQQHEQQRQHLMEQQRKRMFSLDSITTTVNVHTPAQAVGKTAHTTMTSHQHTSARVNSKFENFGDQVLVYESLDAMEWRHLSHIPFGPRHHHAVAVCHGLIYLVGGTRTALGCAKKSIFETSVWCFDPQALKWILESSLPESRRDFAIVSVEKRKCEHCKLAKDRSQHESGFYVIGGEGFNGIALSSVWFYSVRRKIWTRKPPLNVGRYGLAAAMVNDEIWIAGGISNGNNTAGGTPGIASIAATLTDGDGAAAIVDSLKSSTAHVITDTMEIYTLKCSHEVLAYNAEEGFQNVYTAIESNGAFKSGGRADKDACGSATRGGASMAGEMCGCNVGQWIKSKLHLRIPRVFGKFWKMPNGELYLVGGVGPNAKGDLTSLTDIDQYQVEQQQWQHCGDLNWPRHGHDVGLLNDHCFVVVGGVSTAEKRTLSQVEAFCTKTRQCLNHLPELPWPVSGCAVATLK